MRGLQAQHPCIHSYGVCCFFLSRFETFFNSPLAPPFEKKAEKYYTQS